MRTILATFIVASTVMAQTPTKSVPEQGPPPKNLTVRPDGHVSANQDPADADKFEVHVVKQGETLSQIAGEVLKNPRMWPQLWEQNEHIINPHWIYPNDKILIRPVTPLAEAKPPEPPPVVVPPAPEPPPPPRPQAVPTPRPAPAPPVPPRPTVFISDQRAPAPEITFADLYCSGFIRKAAIPKDLKVIARYDATGGALASESDYVYLSEGSQKGVTAGNTYAVVRPTKSVSDPYGQTAVSRDLGMHYLDVAQVKIVVAQPEFSLARIMQSCGDAVEVGDYLVPFQPVAFPQPPRPRPFSSTMTTNGGASGIIVTTKSVLLNFGSAYETTKKIAGVGGNDRLGVTERGLAAAGEVVYIDAGMDKDVKPGDIFIVYRSIDRDHRLFHAPEEFEKIEHTLSAIGEIVVVKVGERASTAVVTYATDALSLGDVVERR